MKKVIFKKMDKMKKVLQIFSDPAAPKKAYQIFVRLLSL
jgi:hypothetical protein